MVGLFLLENLKEVRGIESILYRDDGLGATRTKAARENKAGH